MDKKKGKDDAADETPVEGGEGGEGGEAAPSKKKGLSPKIMIIAGVVVVLLLGAAGAGLYFAGVFTPKEEKPKVEEHHDDAGPDDGLGLDETTPPAEGAAAKPDEHAEKKEDAGGGGGHGGGGKDKKGDPLAGSPFFDLGDLLVNLTSDSKRPNYLKMRVMIELVNASDTKKLEEMKPRILDAFQAYLRELRVDDLRGSAGLYRLREELLLRSAEILKPVRVRDVLFTEILIQ